MTSINDDGDRVLMDDELPVSMNNEKKETTSRSIRFSEADESSPLLQYEQKNQENLAMHRTTSNLLNNNEEDLLQSSSAFLPPPPASFGRFASVKHKCAATSFQLCGTWLPRRWLMVLLTVLAVIFVSLFNNVFTVTVDVHLMKEEKWSQSQRRLAFGGFYWGYVFTALPGGVFSRRFGHRYLVGFGVLCSCLATALTPLIYHEIDLLIAVRVLCGLSQGLVLPSLYTLISRWVPLLERSRAISLAWAGSFVGNILGSLWQEIIQPEVEIDWRWIYFTIAVLGIAWFVLWMSVSVESPADAEYMTKQERRLLADNIPDARFLRAYRARSRALGLSSALQGTAWKKMLGNVHVWAIVVAHFCYSISAYTFFELVPKFMVRYHVYPGNRLLWSELPLISELSMILLGGFLVDWLLKRHLSPSVVRAVAQALSMFVPSTIIILIALVAFDPSMRAVLSLVSVAFMGLSVPGFATSILDCTPMHAGPVFGLSLSVATLPQIFIPYFVPSFIASDDWLKMFIFSAAVNGVGGFVWILAGTSRRVDSKCKLKMSNYVFISQRPEWSDVKPLEQNDGISPVCPISYSEQYKDLSNYFRAVVQNNERSIRALNLITELLSINSAHYTAWYYRRLILQSLKEVDLDGELLWVEEMAENSPKNYQVWQHRRALSDITRDWQRELDFTARALKQDAKNYHVYAYRQYILSTYDDAPQNELKYVDSLIEEDYRNNSAWNLRHFVVFLKGTPSAARLKEECEYALKWISKSPNNQSPWSYLNDLLFKLKESDSSLANEIVQSVIELSTRVPTCSNAFVLLLDLAQAGQVGLDDAATICDKLIALDTLHEKYWRHRRSQL